ncbi:MAG: hypothetical protein IJC66_05095, partial [Kiritimatiellae bacterium]|nr:hypothetical protein [Kiritimatiellia bacterium]
MNRYWTAVTVFLHVLGAIVFTCAAAQEDAADPRMRTYVYPKRIVWCTPSGKHKDGWEARGYVEKPELLLERKFGQVCEGRFATQNGCRLVNRGEPPGMILDFGRELHGSIQ